MEFTYMKTPLNRFIFTNRRIREWVEENAEGKVLNLFAGKQLLNCDEIRNDIDHDMVAWYHVDALVFVKNWQKGRFNTVLLDPPSSYRKSIGTYGGKVTSPFNALKDNIVNVLQPNGIVITFGYHSNSMGTRRGFKQEHLLVISHGGAIQDTIAIIERKV